MLIQPGETPESIAMRRRLAAKLMEDASSTAPIGHWLQGANRIAQGLMGGYESRKAGEAEDKATSEGNALLAQLVGGGEAASPSAGSGGPVIPPAPAPASPATASAAQAGRPVEPTMMTAGGGGDMDRYKAGIASIESPGARDPYSLVGPATRTGDRALGKYQVMSGNVPEWTREALGRAMTPQEFLANPQAQETVFEKRFGGYVQKYGNPQDAASAWFTGQPASVGANRRASTPDGRPLGIKGSEYVTKFNSALGGGGGAAPGVAASGGGEGNSRMALAVKLMGNERTRPIGQAILTSALTQERQVPKVVELDMGNGQKISAQQMPDGTLRPVDMSQFGGQAGGQLPPNFDDTQKLRKELTAQKNVAKFDDSIGVYKSMFESASLDSPASDLDMVNGLAKILDPESVVREGEFTTVQKSQSIPDQLKGQLQFVFEGKGKLTPEAREKVMQIANNRMKSYRGLAMKDAERFGGLAQRYKMDPALIRKEFEETPEWKRPSGGKPPPGEGDVINFERGPDGKLRRAQANGG